MWDLPCEPQPWPVYSQALWTDRLGTLSEPPPSCPMTPGPVPYEHDPAGKRMADKLPNCYMAALHISPAHTDREQSQSCLPYLGPVGHESAGHLSVYQSLVVVFEAGVDLGAIAEQYVVHGC